MSLLVSIGILIISLQLTSKLSKGEDFEVGKIIPWYFLGSVILEIIDFFFIKDYIWWYLGIGIVALCVSIVDCVIRKSSIQKKRQAELSVLNAFSPIDKVKDEDLKVSLNESRPYIHTIFGKDGRLERIECDISNLDKWNEGNISHITVNLEKMFPYFQWFSEEDFPSFKCNFVGKNPPPGYAPYPGSYLRPDRWIPLGVDESRELGWNLGASNSTLGESLFKYEDGTTPETPKLSSAPQALCCGSTGGGKSIWLESIVNIIREGIKLAIRWKELRLGDQFPDGSKVVTIHEVENLQCYKVTAKHQELVVSDTHYILCHIPVCLDIKGRKSMFEDIHHCYDGAEIPTIVQNYQTTSGIDIVQGHNVEQVLTSDPCIVDKDHFWLTAENICLLQTMYPNVPIYSGKNRIYVSMDKVKPCFCIQTDTGRYEAGGIISHNSVALQNIIMHCITHNIKLGLVDLKFSEFSVWSKHKNVLGVANTVEQTAELLRLARSVMYKRNERIAKAKIKSLDQYKPQKPTNYYRIFGIKYSGDERLVVKDGDNEKEMSVKDFYEMLQKG